MWRLTTQPLPRAAGTHHQVLAGDEALTFRAVLDLWRDSERFRTFWTQSLADSGYSAFRWETPPVRASTLDRPFEFVLLDCPELDRSVDVRTFSDYFREARQQGGALAVPNQSGDAMLVIPSLEAEKAAYGHLAAFVRDAPADQQHALWQTVANSVGERLSEKTLWLSTAGMGVSWLHVRLDSRPKYYGHAPYRRDAWQ